jgi:hypothetical protein
MTQQTQPPDIVKNVVGVLMLFPPIGIPVFLAGVGIKVAGFMFNAAGTVIGQAGNLIGQAVNVVTGILPLPFKPAAPTKA